MIIYAPERTALLERRAKKAKAAAVVTALCALIAIITICLKTDTANSEIMMYAAMGLSTLAGWAVIVICKCVIKPCEAEASHARGLERAEETIERGVILYLSKPFRIPKSIGIIKVRIETADGEKTLNIIAGRKSALPDTGAECLFRLRRGYITEVTACEG